MRVVVVSISKPIALPEPPVFDQIISFKKIAGSIRFIGFSKPGRCLYKARVLRTRLQRNDCEPTFACFSVPGPEF